jgi:hypothetical protein
MTRSQLTIVTHVLIWKHIVSLPIWKHIASSTSGYGSSHTFEKAGKLRMGVKGMDRIIVTQPRHSKVANSASYYSV